MTEEVKLKLFEEMLRLEHLAEIETYDSDDYYYQSQGAFKMLEILGLAKEYIWWAVGK